MINKIYFGYFDNYGGSLFLSKTEFNNIINAIKSNKKYDLKISEYNIKKYSLGCKNMLITNNKTSYFVETEKLINIDKNTCTSTSEKIYINELEFPILNKYDQEINNNITIFSSRNFKIIATDDYKIHIEHQNDNLAQYFKKIIIDNMAK